jgi:hypothetical protein
MIRCETCGKEFQTYSGVCPYCHARAEGGCAPRSAAFARPGPRDDGELGDSPPGTAPIEAAGAPPAARPVRPDYRRPSRRPPERALKGLLVCGSVLLVVLVAWAAFVSVPGLFPLTLTLGTAPTPAATDPPLPTIAAVTTRPAVATAAPTRSADILKPYSADPDATRQIAPGHRVTAGTPAAAPTRSGTGSIVGGVTPSPTDSAILPNWTGDDTKYAGYIQSYLSTAEEQFRAILGSSLENEWQEMRNGSEELKRTTAEGISEILPVPDSPNLSDVKNQSLGILDRLASESDRYIAAADSHVRGNETAAGSLIVTGSEEIVRAAGDLERIGEYLPIELTVPV